MGGTGKGVVIVVAVVRTITCLLARQAPSAAPQLIDGFEWAEWGQTNQVGRDTIWTGVGMRRTVSRRLVDIPTIEMVTVLSVYE